MADNWERNQIIGAAAERIMRQADPVILESGKRRQLEVIWQMRHQLVAETGCAFDTTARHISLGRLRSALGRAAAD